MIACGYQSIHGDDDVERQIKEIHRQLEELGHKVALSEMTDNSYSSSGSMWNDIAKRKQLYRQLEDLEAAR